MPELTDDSIMLTGKHKGEKLANIPADYLVWCYENQKCSASVMMYIHKNLDVLKAEVAFKNKNTNR